MYNTEIFNNNNDKFWSRASFISEVGADNLIKKKKQRYA